MRISDWSSDVCSSDLGNAQRTPFALAFRDKHPTHWFGVIGPCRHAGDNRVEVFRSEVREGLAVNTRRHRTLVGSDLLEPLLPKERSEEHTSELQSLMRISYAVFCLQKKNQT